MINVNYERIIDLESALKVIRKLENGLNNCYTAEFYICPYCGEIYVKGYICPECEKDPTEYSVK